MSGIVSLVEVLDEKAPQPAGAVVSLNRESSFALAARGGAFTIPDDYLPMAKLNAMAPEYSRLFAEWIDTLDVQLLREFEGLGPAGIGPARLYGYFLRFITDGFVVTALRVRASLDAVKPDEVVFYTHEIDEPALGPQMEFLGPTLMARVLPLACAKRGIPFRRVLAPCGSVASRAVLRWADRTSVGVRTAARRLKQLAGDLRRTPGDGPAALFLSGGNYSLDAIQTEAASEGYRILRRLGRLSPGRSRPGLALKLNASTKTFSDFAGLDLSPLIEVRIRFFIENICPRLEAGFQSGRELMEKKRVRFVAAPYKWNLEDFALMAAAASSESTLAVQILHGWSVFDDSTWKETERPCNLFIATDDEIGGYFARDVFAGTGAQVKTAALWTKNYVDFPRPPAGGKPVVLYAPTILNPRWLRLQGTMYSDDWYFRHQLRLLEYFHSEKDFHFIWKADCDPGQSLDPIARVIAAAGRGNVEFAGGNFRGHLARAHFAFHDYPSTPMFETLLAGVPTLCVYHESLLVRDSAKRLLDGVMKPFSTTEQAAEAVREFLHGDPKKYLKDIPVSRASAFDVIVDALGARAS